jgi:hypothetical protein
MHLDDWSEGLASTQVFGFGVYPAFGSVANFSMASLLATTPPVKRTQRKRESRKSVVLVKGLV